MKTKNEKKIVGYMIAEFNVEGSIHHTRIMMKMVHERSLNNFPDMHEIPLLRVFVITQKDGFECVTPIKYEIDFSENFYFVEDYGLLSEEDYEEYLYETDDEDFDEDFRIGFSKN